MDQLHLSVKRIGGESCDVDVPVDAKVRDVKEQLQEKQGLDPACISLVKKEGKVRMNNDDDGLKEAFDIQDGDILIALVAKAKEAWTSYDTAQLKVHENGVTVEHVGDFHQRVGATFDKAFQSGVHSWTITTDEGGEGCDYYFGICDSEQLQKEIECKKADQPWSGDLANKPSAWGLYPRTGDVYATNMAATGNRDLDFSDSLANVGSNLGYRGCRFLVTCDMDRRRLSFKPDGQATVEVPIELPEGGVQIWMQFGATGSMLTVTPS